MRRVVCDPIQDGFRAANKNFRQNTCKIDKAYNFTGCGRDANNLARYPDIGINFAVNIFQLVRIFKQEQSSVSEKAKLCTPGSA